MTKYTNPQLREICKSQRIYNNHNFANGQAYIDYYPGENGRIAHFPFWGVVKEGVNLGTASWRDYGRKEITVYARNGKQPALAEAMVFCLKRFGITEWARGPFGAYYEKAFVEKRLAEIIGKHEAAHKEPAQ